MVFPSVLFWFVLFWMVDVICWFAEGAIHPDLQSRWRGEEEEGAAEAGEGAGEFKANINNKLVFRNANNFCVKVLLSVWV